MWKQIKLIHFTIGLIVATIFAIGCKKETVIVTETVIEKDTIISVIKDTTTTFIVLRHAEKVSTGSNPGLSGVGQVRANNLDTLLANVNLDAIYSTNFNRTLQTVQPIALSKMLSILNYNPSNLSSFVDDVLATYHDGIVLVVGHSNTTPDLLNVLTGTNLYTLIPESEYDNLYMVSVFEKGRSEVIHLKY